MIVPFVRPLRSRIGSQKPAPNAAAIAELKSSEAILLTGLRKMRVDRPLLYRAVIRLITRATDSGGAA